MALKSVEITEIPSERISFSGVSLYESTPTSFANFEFGKPDVLYQINQVGFLNHNISRIFFHLMLAGNLINQFTLITIDATKKHKSFNLNWLLDRHQLKPFGKTKLTTLRS